MASGDPRVVDAVVRTIVAIIRENPETALKNLDRDSAASIIPIRIQGEGR